MRTTTLAILALAAAELVATPAAAVTGNAPVVVLLCKFSNHPEEPYSVEYYEDMFSESGAGQLGAFDFWRDVSYGNLDLTGTRVFGWYTVKDANGQYMTSAQFTGLTTDHQVDRCVATAQEDPATAGVDFSRVVMVSALTERDPLVQTTLAADVSDSDTTITVDPSTTGFPSPPFPVYLVASDSPSFPYGDEVNVTAVDGNTWTVVRNYERQGATAHSAGEAVVLLSEPAYQGAPGFCAFPANVSMTGATHEMGHLFGLNHSRKLSTSTTDYCDLYDIMSAACVYTFDGSYNPPGGPGLTTIYQARDGWLAPDRQLFFDNESCNTRTVTLAPLSRPQANGYLAVWIPATLSFSTPGGNSTTTDYYNLEFRHQSGWDRGIPAAAVVLHLRGRDGYSYWVDSAGTNGALLAGAEYVDSANKTYVGINEISDSAERARVTVSGCKIDSSLSYVGPTSARFGEQVLLSVELSVGATGAPIPSAPFTISVGAESCQGTTDPDGTGTCAIEVDQTPGTYTLQTSFPGTQAYESAGASRSFTIEKIPTSLAYAGDTTGDFNDAVMLSARLTAAGGDGLSGKTVTFTLGTQGCSDVTDGSGLASCSFVIAQHPATLTVQASFAEEQYYLGSSTSESFTITREETQVIYTGDLTADYHDPAAISARLVDPVDGVSIPGKTIVFTLGVGDSCSAVSDGSGVAACTIVPSQAAGNYTLTAAFAGDIDYVPSSDSRIFVITREETTTTSTGPLVILGGQPVTLSGRLLEEGVVPIEGRLLTLALGSQSCTGTTDAAGNAACTIASVTVSLGPQPLAASFDGDAFYLPSADTSRQAIVFAFPSRGAFALGDLTVASASPTTTVTWWGDSWSSLNSLSGGPVSPSFKGFVGAPSSNPPACGATWTTSPGNSPPPVSGVPAYMGVVVASAVSKSGSTFSGNALQIVVVRTEPGYEPNPMSVGTGVIVATYCR